MTSTYFKSILLSARERADMAQNDFTSLFWIFSVEQHRSRAKEKKYSYFKESPQERPAEIFIK